MSHAVPQSSRPSFLAATCDVAKDGNRPKALRSPDAATSVRRCVLAALPSPCPGDATSGVGGRASGAKKGAMAAVTASCGQTSCHVISGQGAQRGAGQGRHVGGRAAGQGGRHDDVTMGGGAEVRETRGHRHRTQRTAGVCCRRRARDSWCGQQGGHEAEELHAGAFQLCRAQQRRPRRACRRAGRPGRRLSRRWGRLGGHSNCRGVEQRQQRVRRAVSCKVQQIAP